MFPKSKSYENIEKSSNKKNSIRPVVSCNDVDSLNEEKNSFLIYCFFCIFLYR